MKRLVPLLLFTASVISVLVTLSIFGFMILLGLPLFEEGRFFPLMTASWEPTEGIYGIGPMITGTIAIASLGVAIGFPLSLGSAALLNGIAKQRSAFFLKRIVEMMTGIPTVVYGFVGIFLLVPMIREGFGNGSGMCILSAGLLLSLLISPTMILFFSESFRQVPADTQLAVDALGANRVQKFLYLTLPSSARGIVTGLVMGMGRAVGDTMIALMVSGNAIAVPESVLDSARTLTAHIALIIAADFDSLEFKTLFACGIILYLYSACCVLIVRVAVKRGQNAW